MKPRAEFQDWDTVDYREALERQRTLFEVLAAPTTQKPSAEVAAPATLPEADSVGWLIFCEHPHVYTLGRSGKEDNLLVDEEFLCSKGVSLHRTERGGDITYHGPGQIVGYPILDLQRLGLGLRRYVEALEEAVIETTAEFGINAGRVPGKTGVWVRDKKICAIGVRASRGVVMHGFALNVSTDLRWFELVNPCGFVGGAVTSMEKETGRKIEIDEVKKLLCERLKENLKI